MAESVVVTPAGELAVATRPGQVWRIGYRPAPWAWTPWQYAGVEGRFTGRWDDPRGAFRTICAGRELLACLGGPRSVPPRPAAGARPGQH